MIFDIPVRPKIYDQARNTLREKIKKMQDKLDEVQKENQTLNKRVIEMAEQIEESDSKKKR